MPSTVPTRAITVLRFLPVVAWMGLIFTLSHQPTLPRVPGLASSLTSIAGHFSVYFVLAVLAWWTLGAFDISQPARLRIAFVIAVLYGFSDEWHQSFIEGRNASLMDNLVDSIGAACGLATVSWLRRSGKLPKRWM